MIKFHKISLNNVLIHYAEAPGPGPALVIAHGLTGSHAEFLHLVPELARQAHVYLLDLRGHGLSGRTESGYQVADYADDVAAFLRQVVGQPALLLGHSLGSVVAVWLAGHSPHLLRGVVLEDLPIYMLQMPRFAETEFYGYFASLRDYLGRYHANGANIEEMAAYVGQAPVDDNNPLLDVAGPEAVLERATQLHQIDVGVLEPVLAGTLIGNQDPDALLAQVRCPVHLLAAQFDLGGAMEARDIERAVAHMPHCTYAVIKGASHDIHLTQPEAFLREVRGFLEAVREQVSIVK